MPGEVKDGSAGNLSVAVLWSMAVASVLYIIGFSSVGWETASNAWIGLWSTCSTESHFYNIQSWFKATQGMMTLGLILLIGSLIFLLIYTFVNLTNKSFQLKMFAILDIVAVVFMVIGLIIFGSRHDFQLHYAFVLCVCGAIVCFIAGILAIVQLWQ